MSVSLAYLVDSVRSDLTDDVADAFPEGFFERAINEGQSRYEPELYRKRVVTGVTIAVDATTYALPADALDPANIEWVRDEDNYGYLPAMRQVDQTMYFSCPVDVEWTGTIFYRAHYPEITDGQDCLLPRAAADGLISFALYRAFRRLAAGRSEYRRYATIVGNGVAMADLEQAASIHLQDFEESRVSADSLPEPVNPWDD